ncbi:MAG TPA: hypothetical protein VFL96_01935 [Acidobacteriaceae bacterium]|nr:hypothetical protein [Acidobacteriaceae bacterium]
MLVDGIGRNRLRNAGSQLGVLMLLVMLAAAPGAVAQRFGTPGKSIGTVTTRGNLIILTLNEDALGKPHLFDLSHRTLRFTPKDSGYTVETLPEAWDSDFGPEIKDPDVTLTKMTFPFSGQKWSKFSVGVTGSITFGEPERPSGRFGRMRGAAFRNREGGLSVERYALLQQVGSTFINATPAISVFFKPRMRGERFVNELSDRTVVTWTLTEPYAGIQDWTWYPTVNRFQAVLHANGEIDLTYDKVSARDGIVGIFPKIESTQEQPLTTLMANAASSPLAVRSIRLSEVGGVYLQAQLETVGPLPAADATEAEGLQYHLCLSAKESAGPCTNATKGATVWSVMSMSRFRGRRSRAGSGPRYFGFGDGLSPEVKVEGNTITLKGTLPVGFHAGSRLYVSASEQNGEAQPTAFAAQSVRLKGISSPEMDLSTLKGNAGPFPTIYESFYYPESPRPNDLTCSVIKALGDKFDMLAYYSDFRIDNPEAGTPSTGPLGGGPNGGEVTGINAKQRNLAGYCTKGRFQWQYVQPVDMHANQMDEYPPADVKDPSDHDIVSYTHQLSERTFNGKIPPYDYAMSQIGHEMDHRWSAFVSAKIDGKLIPLGPTHWDMGLQAPAAFPYQRPTEASAMGGGVWQDNFDGTFTQLDDNYYVPATGYSYLDLYLMGLVAPSEVPDFFLLRNLQPVGRDANGHRIFKADRIKVTIKDVIAAEGPREPDVDHSQRHFNTGMVIVLRHGDQPPAQLIRDVNGIRLRWMDYWTTVTGHRSTMTTNPR